MVMDMAPGDQCQMASCPITPAFPCLTYSHWSVSYLQTWASREDDLPSDLGEVASLSAVSVVPRTGEV